MSANNVPMSKKDKMLIYMCVLLVIVSVAYIFGISPLVDQKDKLTKTLENKTAMADEVQAEIMMYEIIKDQSSESADVYINASSDYPTPMFYSDVDDYLTREMQKLSLKPVSLGFPDVDDSQAEIQVSPFNYVVEGNSQELQPISVVTEMAVDIVCDGSLDNVKRYIDLLYATKGLFVESTALSVNDNSANSGDKTIISLSEGSPNVEAAISVKYYIYDKAYYENQILSSAETEEIISDE